MSAQQVVSVSVHNPKVVKVQRFQRNGGLLITLGGMEDRGSVDVFVSDTDWNSIVRDVRAMSADADTIPVSEK